jgi:hypothetical protein
MRSKPPIKKPIVWTSEKIQERSMPVTECGCWIWMKSVGGPMGYGMAGRHGRAHRLSWIVHRGPIPEGLNVLHKCDTPSCVNPEHLFLGTHADNMRDSSEKGRQYDRRGEKNPKARITPDQVRMIRECPLSLRKTAAKLGIPFGTVADVRKGRTWSNTL